MDRNEIYVKILDTPESAVSRYLAEKIGLNFRCSKVLWSRKRKGIMEVTLKLVIPQQCKCCKQSTDAKIIENAGTVYVRKLDAPINGITWVVDDVKFRNCKKEIGEYIP
jgi:hypothetical protein